MEDQTGIAIERLANQKLAGPRLRSPAEVVGWLGAVQAQDYAAAKWALAQRTVGTSDAQVDAAFDAGAFLRTHVLRPTWHFVLPEELGWMLALTAPRVNAGNAGRYRELELDEDVFARSRPVLESALRDGQYKDRNELRAVLENAGLPMPGQRLAHLIMHAELEGLLCSGPRRGKQFTYALMAERVPSPPKVERDEALAELVRRYFTSRGPARIKDFVWWSGLTVADARRGIDLLGPALAQEQVDGQEYWVAPGGTAEAPASPLATLLSSYDECMVAYADRSAYTVGQDLYPDARGISPLLLNYSFLIDGQAAGSWRRTLSKREVRLEFSPFRLLDEVEQAVLEREVVRYADFLSLPAVITFLP